jgi:hypothetical protein
MLVEDRVDVEGRGQSAHLQRSGFSCDDLTESKKKEI